MQAMERRMRSLNKQAEVCFAHISPSLCHHAHTCVMLLFRKTEEQRKVNCVVDNFGIVAEKVCSNDPRNCATSKVGGGPQYEF